MISVDYHQQQIYYQHHKTKVIIIYKTKSHSPAQEYIHYYWVKTDICIPAMEKLPSLCKGNFGKIKSRSQHCGPSWSLYYY